MSGQPTVTVRFPDGEREWPAHYEQGDSIGDPFSPWSGLPRLVPDYREGYEFRETNQGWHGSRFSL